MISDSTGYDHLASQYSPEGRIYQVEYATKAALRNGTAIGLRGSDGIVLASVHFKDSPLYEKNSNTRIFTIYEDIGAVVAGFLPDARAMVNIARSEASEYRKMYKSPAPLNFITQRVGQQVHACTLFGGFRPFGASLILGAYESDGPQLYRIHPSGAVAGYIGCAIGKNADAARSEMESIDIKNIPIMQLIKDAARVMYAVHNDERTSTNFEIELSWCGKITNGKHVTVSQRVFKEAKDYAENMMNNEESHDSE